ncbi:hypothetical protein K450DRAFT_281762 [Umbelopsis ramanniana AG]|uniref:Peptidase A1 domain-containing protein n=1 Tax=Umbelopsis ramanniana AG TaxID=1314678 RepID=A0AAD5E6K4_UMBRA|nr:uncharacterized protein K450DRAFT_281762 [Umbelopsis ramanniana AG]KAI8578331.1 hypothetical protein K450DRAFT_281762 [Umbelopsis ramanniana AG]
MSNHRFKSTQKRSAESEPLINKITQYVAVIGVGSPTTNYSLLVDTGSSNTFVGSSKAYVKTPTSVDLNSTFAIKYSVSNATGELYKDSVTIASLVIPAQIIGVANATISELSGLDGILGVGPSDLTQGTSPYAKTIPSVLENLFSQKLIPSNVFALSFRPSTGEEEMNGEITLGGIDSSKFTGAISYVPLSKTLPSTLYWGVDASAHYGPGKTPIFNSTAGIVDSGTTMIELGTYAYKTYQMVTGAVPDVKTGLLALNAAQFSALQSLYFNIGGKAYEVTANAQIFPRKFNSLIDGDVNKIYLIVGDLKSAPSSGMDFILGQTFLERYYSVYDTSNARIGLATTEYTLATSN